MIKVGILLRYNKISDKVVFRESYTISKFFVDVARALNWQLVPILGYPLNEYVQSFDALIVPGHENSMYDEATFDMQIIGMFLAQNKPVLGICGGMQTINIMRGGTLKEVGGHVDSRHGLVTKHSTILEGVNNVNSFHYYACDKLGDGLRACATSKDDIIEAIMSNDKLLYGVQWHPEADYDLQFFKRWIGWAK